MTTASAGPERTVQRASSVVRASSPTLAALTTAAYAVLGSILVWSRLAGLGTSLCCDELATVEHYVRGGPATILTGSYVPNNHELFSLLGWATTSLVGESEIALRLGSVVPFLLGVAVVTVWLHLRLGALAGLLFLFLTTFSPLLLDLSRQARGYGLAFLAMSVMLVAALEASRSGRTKWVAAFCAAGLVGTLTLPNFVIAFLATGAVLVSRRELRTRFAWGLAASVLAIAVWYAPHVDDIARSSRQSYGVPIESVWILTAPLDQTLVPAVTVIDDAFFEPDLGSLVLVLAFAVLIASSPLLREWRSALVTVGGTLATVLAFWVTGTEVVPRFFSFLLVPLFALVASGAASILARVRTRPPALRSLVALATLAFVAITAVPFLTSIPRVPRDPLRDVAAVIAARAPASAPVYAYVPYPLDLVFHLGRPVRWPRTPAPPGPGRSTSASSSTPTAGTPTCGSSRPPADPWATGPFGTIDRDGRRPLDPDARVQRADDRRGGDRRRPRRSASGERAPADRRGRRLDRRHARAPRLP
jgi:hypothetical protein